MGSDRLHDVSGETSLLPRLPLALPMESDRWKLEVEERPRMQSEGLALPGCQDTVREMMYIPCLGGVGKAQLKDAITDASRLSMSYNSSLRLALCFVQVRWLRVLINGRSGSSSRAIQDPP